MSIADQVSNILKSEKDRKAADSQFARAIEAIDKLKKDGVLARTRYTLPPNDTVGRHVAREAAAQDGSERR
jgi:MoaA/NifB/PqqE/SkfB family radical SAM enzyme